MVGVQLPSLFASSFSTIQWPLTGPNASPPLHYLTLTELQTIRSSSSSSHSSNHDLEQALQDLPSTLDRLFSPSPQDSHPSSSEQIGSSDVPEASFGWIALSLVLLGHGYTDECHNLMTPLSWPDDIHFAHGPARYGTTSPEARAFATYVHSLVHRREAYNRGEFGMVGFANANFWSNAVGECEKVDVILPHSELCAAVIKLAQKEDYSNIPAIQSWCQDHGFESNVNVDTMYFESRAIHELCATVLRNNQQQDDPQNQKLKSFAEQVVCIEIKIMLYHVLDRVGYDVSDLSMHAAAVPAPASYLAGQIDEDVALTAARKVSSAHSANFGTHSRIILRRILPVNTNDDALYYSAAAGVACRLQDSAACKQVDVMNTSSGVTGVLKLTIAIGDDSASDLGKYDCLVQKLDSLTTMEGDDNSMSHDGMIIINLQMCAADDPDVLYVDRLHGTRGDTPTTVVQWSKGTIF